MDLNATQAAVRAGHSVRTANEQAVRLMRRPAIATALQTAMDARAEAIRLKAEAERLFRRWCWRGSR